MLLLHLPWDQGYNVNSVAVRVGEGEERKRNDMLLLYLPWDQGYNVNSEAV